MTENLISCGLPVIDDELGGGLEKGSLVYVMADSMAMAEIFLYYFVQNKTAYYFNTERKPDFIKSNIEHINFDTDLVKFIDVHKEYYEYDTKILDHGMVTRDYMIIDFINKQLDTIEEMGANLVVDTITFFFNLNVKRVLIQELIDKLYNTTKRMGGLGFLYGVKNETRSPIENEVMNRCDAIFEISVVKKSDRIVTVLTIPKARDRPIRGNIITFRIENKIIMDTSREIA